MIIKYLTTCIPFMEPNLTCSTFPGATCTPENYELVERLVLDITSIRGYCTPVQVPSPFNATGSILRPSRMKIIERSSVLKFVNIQN